MRIAWMKILFIAAAAGTALLSLPYGSNGAFRIIAAAAFVAGAFLRQGTDDNTILTLATGELLVIAVAEAFFPAGFIVQSAVAGAALTGGRETAGTWDIPLFALYCLVAIAGAVILDRSDQLLLPFLAMVAIVVMIILAAIGIQEIRERRESPGGTP